MSHLTISGIVHMFCVRKEMISDGDKIVFDNSKFKKTEQKPQQKLVQLWKSKRNAALDCLINNKSNVKLTIDKKLKN